MAPYKPPAPDLARALAELPLVVVPQVVLFPGVRVSLHLGRPRQVQALRAALAQHHVLGVVQPAIPGDPSAGPAPPCAIGGAGTIVDHAENPRGRHQLVVLGRARVRLRELDTPAPYRCAEATVLPSLDTVVEPVELSALHRAAKRFETLLDRGQQALDRSPPSQGDPGALADHYAHALMPDARQRQQVQETLDIGERVRRVTEILTLQCCILGDPPSGPSN